jgi:Protein of unknown function (DUF3108)
VLPAKLARQFAVRTGYSGGADPVQRASGLETVGFFLDRCPVQLENRVRRHSNPDKIMFLDRRFSSHIAFGAALLSSLPAPAATLHVQYSVSLIGLPIGVAALTGIFGPTSYKLDGNARMTGLASILVSSKGAAAASGAISAGRIIPTTYTTTAANATESRRIRMVMAGGAVKGVEIVPPLDDRPGRVPVTERDKKDVIDPMSALVMPVPANEALVGPAACDRKLPIFDGGMRFDVTLSFVGVRQVKTTGYAGPVTVCAARYTPIAGYRPDRKATRFMADNRQIETWLAPVQGSHVVLPYRIALMTMIGMTVIEAAEFSVDTSTSSAAPN